jgi:hypothetical protein
VLCDIAVKEDDWDAAAAIVWRCFGIWRFLYSSISGFEPPKKRFAEKIITKAKKNDLHSRRLVARDIHDKVVLAKIFDDYVPRYADRPGGYTRMVKMGPRQGDCAAMSIIELVDNNLEFAD